VNHKVKVKVVKSEQDGLTNSYYLERLGFNVGPVICKATEGGGFFLVERIAALESQRDELLNGYKELFEAVHFGSFPPFTMIDAARELIEKIEADL
jgi:hypothetical protein